MTVFDRVKLLAEKQGLSIVQLEEKLHFGRNSLYSWKKKTPNGDRLKKVADFFHVSTDYLLGRDSSYSGVEEDLERSIDNARSFDGKPISDQDREKVKNILRGYFED